MNIWEILGGVALVAIFLGRSAIWHFINVKLQFARTKHPSDAKFEYIRGGAPVKTISVKGGKKSCNVTVTFDDNGTTVTEATKKIPAEFLLELEDIAIKHNMQELKNLPYADGSGSRNFSLFYGRQSVYHVDYRQEHHQEVKELLDEIEACFKKYID